MVKLIIIIFVFLVVGSFIGSIMVGYKAAKKLNEKNITNK